MRTSTQTEPVPTATANGFIDFDGERCYRIGDHDRLTPFLMSVVSPADHWCFVSSAGGLTCGRRTADEAIFPYETEDRLHAACGASGAFTRFWVEDCGRRVFWEPFHPDGRRSFRLGRSLVRNLAGTRLWFEEVNFDLRLTFTVSWSASRRFGFLRRCELGNLSDEERALVAIDGARNMLCPGIPLVLEQTMSSLADAYKRAELREGSMAIFYLNAHNSDRPEPAECLRASAWATSLPGAAMSLDERSVTELERGSSWCRVPLTEGRRFACFAKADVNLGPLSTLAWHVALDTGLGAADVARFEAVTRDKSFDEAAERDMKGMASELTDLVASADGLEVSGDEACSARHRANTLFNAMRGGVFAEAMTVRRDDFTAFVRERNRPLAKRLASRLAALPERLDAAELRTHAKGEADLERLALEYLPLYFSRRHGDPSRPWNRFAVSVAHTDGSPRLAWEGNWRDIFQNWEALCFGNPAFYERAVAVFVNATNAFGYNAYRISREGVDWEIPHPDVPWSNIGFWGDHQLVYLLRLLEKQEAFFPGSLGARFDDDAFVFADIPYDLRTLDELLDNPRHAVDFDLGRHRNLIKRTQAIGGDGKLLASGNEVRQANLAEKLLIPLLAKLSSFVPGAGVWMNTQRPEWNDAQNALAGYGASVVTLAAMRAYSGFLAEVFSADDRDTLPLATGIVEWCDRLERALARHRDASTLGARLDAVRALFGAGATYRAGLERASCWKRRPVERERLVRLLTLVVEIADEHIEKNRRDDGLFHAYNRLDISASGIGIRRLPLMLEGQAAILASGALDADAAAAMLVCLRASELYRADQKSYLLYPARRPKAFMDRGRVETSEALAAKCLDPASGIFERDVERTLRFHPDLRHAADLRERIESCGLRFSKAESARLAKLFEECFRHREFTGRASAMFANEGNGSIYWHMVAKLLLAAQETIVRAEEVHGKVPAQLVRRYVELRAGFGWNKTPEQYGAFPFDPYSYTPRYAGAQQPGMTGAVKEELLVRFGELGVRVRGGRLVIRPTLLSRRDFTSAPTVFHYIDAVRRRDSLPLEEGSLGFTFCGVPVILHRADAETPLRITWRDGRSIETNGPLDVEMSRSIFLRRGLVAKLEATVAAKLIRK